MNYISKLRAQGVIDPGLTAGILDQLDHENKTKRGQNHYNQGGICIEPFNVRRTHRTSTRVFQIQNHLLLTFNTVTPSKTWISIGCSFLLQGLLRIFGTERRFDLEDGVHTHFWWVCLRDLESPQIRCLITMFPLNIIIICYMKIPSSSSLIDDRRLPLSLSPFRAQNVKQHSVTAHGED